MCSTCSTCPPAWRAVLQGERARSRYGKSAPRPAHYRFGTRAGGHFAGDCFQKRGLMAIDLDLRDIHHEVEIADLVQRIRQGFDDVFNAVRPAHRFRLRTAR